MVYLLFLLIANSISAYEWQSLPSPGIRNHDHAVVYNPVNDIFFIIGGDSTGNETNMDICLMFDPKTNTWKTKAPMPTKRARHRAAYRSSLIRTLSSKDRCEENRGFIHVLCGKDDNGRHLNTHEVYNIKKDRWYTKAPAPLAVSRPSVITWRDSLIYLMGGYDVSHTARTEVHYYDPETDSWHPATSLPRGLHGGGTDIKGDSIFIIGGADGSLRYTNILVGVINPADPSIISWSWGDSLPMYDNANNMLAIKDTKAYMIGGQFNDGTNEVWEYDIANQTWASLPDYPTPFISRGDFAKRREGPDSSGIVYCFMGDTSNYWSREPTDKCFRLIEIYEEEDDSVYSWQSLPSPGIRNHDHAVVYDPNNDLFFIIGGDSTGHYTNMDICLAFEPETNTWDTKAPMPTKRARHRAAYISGLRAKDRCKKDKGFIHVLCGKDDNGDLIKTHEVYDIKNNSWSTRAPAPVAVSRPSVVPWRDSLVYLMGGYNPATTGVYYYDTKNDSWHSATSLPRRLHGGGAEIKGDTIFIIGGADGSSAYSSILIGEINPSDPTDINWYWGEPLPLPSNQYNNGLAIKDNKAYMIGGLYNDGTNQVWEYDIPGETWTQLPDYPTNVIIRGDFAEKRDGPDSIGVVYCFMGDTTSFFSRKPTDECYKLIRTDTLPPENRVKTEDISIEKNFISLNNSICLTDEISIKFNLPENSNFKIHMYNISGREVLSRFEGNISSGEHIITLDKNLSNGIYFIKVEAAGIVAFEKLILIR